MTDPLSVAAGIVGLISLGIQVTESLVKFYTSYKGQDTDVIRTTEKLERMHNVDIMATHCRRHQSEVTTRCISRYQQSSGVSKNSGVSVLTTLSF